MTTIVPVPVDEAIAGAPPSDVPRNTLLWIWRTMSRIRALENQVVDAFAKGLIPGSTHPCIGQEAIAAGTIAALEPSDLILATYRGHGECLAKGMDPTAMLAELMCREDGVCHGKGGSMHLADPSVGAISTNAIVAGHIPMAGGVALAEKRRGLGRVVLCYHGDGAACEGEFFETLNMAQLWQIPLIFICENNGLAISVPTAKSQATPDIADRASGVGMRARIVDGNDPLAVFRATREAVEHARAGNGPSFVECKTVRWERHSAFSAGGTDPAEARRRWQSVDPIPRFRSALEAWHVATADELDAAVREAETEASEARAAAEASPPPAPDSIYEHIFAEGRV